MSFGLLSLVPKQADGSPLTDYNKAIIYTGEAELKAWASIAQYMQSFGDTDGDGVGDVPEVYGTTEGRKVVEDSKALGDLLKNPSKFFWMILGIVALILIILVAIVIAIVKVVKVVIRKTRTNKIAVEEEK